MKTDILIKFRRYLLLIICLLTGLSAGLVSTQVVAQNEGVEINQGMTDAWYNPLTDGQGLFIIVWGDLKTIFLSWFTYDTERPPEDVMAHLGEPGHRWLTGQGTYEGSVATLNLSLTQGGVFDAAQPPAVTDQDPYGTATIDWGDCDSAFMTYSIPELGLEDRGVILTRITEDNKTLCEELQPDP